MPESVSCEELKELLQYDPSSGRFFWHKNIGSRAQKGAIAGCYSEGRLVIKIDGKAYLGSRLAFLYMNGHWPKGVIDHEDRDTLNNKWNNLRELSRADNSMHSKMRPNNTSGYKGVVYHKANNKWISFIGNRKYVGSFSTAKEAFEARLQALDKIYRKDCRGVQEA